MAFHPLERLHNLHDGFQRAYKVSGHSLLLCQTEGSVYLIENRCPHMDVELTNALILPGRMLRCRAHGIEFGLDSGRAAGPLSDTLDCLTRFSLVYEGQYVGVDL